MFKGCAYCINFIIKLHKVFTHQLVWYEGSFVHTGNQVWVTICQQAAKDVGNGYWDVGYGYWDVGVRTHTR